MPNTAYDFCLDYCGPWLWGDMRYSSIIDACLDILDRMEKHGIELPCDDDNIRMNAAYFGLQLDAIDEEDKEGAVDFILDDIFNVINSVLPHPYWFGPHPDDTACLGLWDFEA